MSWAVTKKIYLGIVIFSLSIALGFSVLGFWPILPFAGAELLALGAALYLCGRAGQQWERVVIDDTHVAVEKEVQRGARRWQFQRAWTRVRLARPSVAWYPSQLLVGSHGKEVELGRFLNEEERQCLAGQLAELIKGLR